MLPSRSIVNEYDSPHNLSRTPLPVCPSPRRDTLPVETAVVSRLRGFHANQIKKASGQDLPAGALQNIVRVIFLRQGIPTLGTFCLLLLGSAVSSNRSSAVYIASTVCILLLYSLYSFLQYALLRARATEMRSRTLRVLEEVADRWARQLAEYDAGHVVTLSGQRSANASFIGYDSGAWAAPSQHPPQTTLALVEPDNATDLSQKRSGAFLALDAALLAARSLRLVAARTNSHDGEERTTSALMVIPKCLLLRGNLTQRFDEYELQWEGNREGSRDLCKLLDCLRVILERDAIMLKALMNLSRPPRLPNLRIAALLEEEVETTDDSDGERETRSVIGGQSTTSMPQRMEYFVMRLLTLLWAVTLLLLALVGLFRTLLGEGERSLGYECLVQPIVVVLGFLPLNSFMVNRFLYLVNNARVHAYASRLLQQHRSQSGRTAGSSIFDQDLISPTTLQLLTTAWRVVRDPGMHADLPVYLARSTVETLGTVTVVAELDSTGILTDMVPLPVALLVIKENPGEDDSSSSSDEDERLFLTQKSLEATRQRKREMRIQVRRKRFQEERFTELRLSASTEPHLTVEFSEPEEQRSNAPSVNPLCLCAVLHAFAPTPADTFAWSEGLHFVDRARSWSQNLFWVARAAGFHEDAVKGFHMFARVFSVHSSKCAEVDSVAARYPEQSCSVICRDVQNQVHVFMIGTTKTVLDACSSYWTGKETEEFDDHEKAEVRFIADKQWGTVQGMEAVAISHRVLPDRYQRWVEALEESCRLLGRPVERYFVNGVQVRNDASVTAAAELPFATGLPRKGSATDFLDDSVLLADSGLRMARPPRLRKVLSHGDLPQFHGGPLEQDSTLSAETFVPLMISTSHTLLGLVALRDSIRPHVQSAIQALDDAGIRFMHFGSGSEQRTKAFGDRIGLETDWNCCISLKAESVALDPHSIRAQLPFGIPSIRKHIIYVDPIPLQVNLFSHSRGVSTRSMISVLQDNHEVVLGLGSVLNHCNTRALVQADYSVGVLPSRDGAAYHKYNTELFKATKKRLLDPTNIMPSSTDGLGKVSCVSGDDEERADSTALGGVLRNVADLLGTACTLDVGRCPLVIPILVRLIRESRMLLSAMSNCNEYILHANGFLVLVNTATVVFGLPLFLSTGSIVFTLNVVIPLLGLGCNNSMVAATDPMMVKQAKQNFDTRLDIFLHASFVFLMRYTPSVVAGVVFPVVLTHLWCREDVVVVDGVLNTTVVSTVPLSPWKLSAESTNPVQSQCLGDVQSVTFFFIVLWLCAHALTHLSRHQSVGLVTEGFRRGANPGRARFNIMLAHGFFGFVVTVLTSSVLFHFLFVHSPHDFANKLSAPVVLWMLLALSFPSVLFGLDIPIKIWRAKRYSDMQKFRTLSYGTRLGMHSPRGDYEPSEENSDEDEQHTGGEHTTNAHHEHSDGAVANEQHHVERSLRRNLKEFLFRWCSILHGSLENQCVCCDHDGGHPAQYGAI